MRRLVVALTVAAVSMTAPSFVTVLSLPYLLDQLVPRLAAAVDGDPSTATTPAD
jgi:iron complex transport system substrate-binding protein